MKEGQKFVHQYSQLMQMNRTVFAEVWLGSLLSRICYQEITEYEHDHRSIRSLSNVPNTLNCERSRS